MQTTRGTFLLAAAAAGFIIGAPALAGAQAASKEVVGTLGNNEGYLVDGKNFQIVNGKAKGDVSGLIAKLNAKEIGPGIIVFRSGDKVYIAEAPKVASPQAMKEFQDQWAVSYAKAMKDFQDNWAVSYAKNFQDNWAVSYLKDFQESWNVSYAKAAKDFQEQWNVSYMKNHQDNWNVSYMNQVKSFQDHWATSYMK